MENENGHKEWRMNRDGERMIEVKSNKFVFEDDKYKTFSYSCQINIFLHSCQIDHNDEYPYIPVMSELGHIRGKYKK